MKRKHLWIIVVVLYILFIYSNSMKVSAVSSEDSGRVLQIIQEIFQKFQLNAGWLTEHIIRKTGHFLEYSVLGVLLYGCMRSLELKREIRWSVHIIIGFLVPFIDETIQLFIEGRSGQISDVWLDCGGIVFGTLFTIGFLLISKRMENTHVKKLSNRLRI
ncbi:VanZ family protein [Clostridium sp. HBUAS56010]|uniref:VanZ family protein n=1 Tax=Clostridium sp. HBUAS56010 TaxID=2571127 RepID=UPI001178CB75|nr:VanZ family protein [Clostridium sp. HBUAS56010]